MAESTGVTIDELLADTETETVKQIVELKTERTSQIAQLREALRAYALHLVQTLQEGNKRKLGMTKDELAEWESKFTSVETLPTDYKSYAEGLCQAFVSETRDWNMDYHRSETFREHTRAVNEYAWRDYADYIVHTLNTELSGDENEEKRRHALAGLLRHDKESFICVINDHFTEPIIFIKPEIKKILSENTVADIARHALITNALFRMRRSDNDNIKTYTRSLTTLYSLEHKDTWAKSGGDEYNARDHISGSNIRMDQIERQRMIEDMASKEIMFANEIDAIVKFLYDSLSIKEQIDITPNRLNDYRFLSPVWELVENRRPARFKSKINAPVTPEGVFYSNMDIPEDERITMEQATKERRAFMQGLSDTLNNAKKPHERRVVTAEDTSRRNDERIAIAEQQALDAMSHRKEQNAELDRLRTEKLAIEERARKDIQRLEGELKSKDATLETFKGTLSRTKEEAENDRKTLEKSKKNAIAEKNKELEDRDSEIKKLKSLLDKVQGVVDKPAGMLGGRKDQFNEIEQLLATERPKKKS